MVPQRTLAPSWSPDSRWVAFATRLDTLYRAIVVANVETGEQRQITDGLADAIYPVWDASGKYLWFLASTDLGLRSQWLDMTSYEHAADLRPLRRGAAQGRAEPGAAAERRGRRRRRQGRAGAARRVEPPRSSSTSTACSSASSPCPASPERQYARLAAGAPGTVFFLEAPPVAERGGRAAGHGSTLRRYRLHRADVGELRRQRRRLRGERRRQEARLPHAGAAGAPRAAASAAPPPLHLVDADDKAPDAGAGRLDRDAAHAARPEGRVPADLRRGLALPARLPLRAQPAGRRLAGDEDDVRRSCCRTCMHRADLNYLLDMMGGEIAIGHSYVRGGDLPEVPPTRGGLLGADIAVENGRYRITRIYDGESWNPDLRAPLAAPGRRRGGGRLRAGGQRRGAGRRRQPAPPARRHRQPADRAHA